MAAAKDVTTRINRPSLDLEQAFKTKADATHWKRMVEDTIEKLGGQAQWFDLSAYAAGLADTVRQHGGKATREAWLRADVPPQDWARGLVFGAADEIEARMRDVLTGRRPR